MYRILHFRGGLYKFDELTEYVEDVGGLVFNKDHFEIIRGDSYLSTEVHVLLMVPEEELEPIYSIISEIKGMYEDIEISDKQKIHFFSYLSIYDALNRFDSWIKKEDLMDILLCPCHAMPCKEGGDIGCILSHELDKILEAMGDDEIIESKKEGNEVFYRLKKTK